MKYIANVIMLVPEFGIESTFTYPRKTKKFKTYWKAVLWVRFVAWFMDYFMVEKGYGIVHNIKEIKN